MKTILVRITLCVCVVCCVCAVYVCVSIRESVDSLCRDGADARIT